MSKAASAVDPPESKQGKKRRQNEKKEEQRLLNTVNGFLSSIIENPTRWKDPLADGLRDFVSQVARDPKTFPINLPHERSGELSPIGNQLVPKLSRGFVEAISSFETFSKGFCATFLDQPIVQVIAMSVSKRMYRGCAYVVHTLDVVDGDGKLLTVKADTALNRSLSTLIHEGSIIELNYYSPIYFCYPTSQEQLHPLVLLHNVIPLGTQPLNDTNKLSRVPALLRQTAISDENNAFNQDSGQDGHEDGGGNQDGAQDSNRSENDGVDSNDQGNQDGDDSGDGGEGKDNNNQCNGHRCSLYGIQFGNCITQVIPPQTRHLVTIALENPYVTKEVPNMNNSEKRFLLYYWYMTNIYGITGKGNTRKPPPCLLDSVHEYLPDDHFVGYKTTEQRAAEALAQAAIDNNGP
jgi:hypothetical protein